MRALGTPRLPLWLCTPEHSHEEAATLQFPAVQGASLHDVLRSGGHPPVELLCNALLAARELRVEPGLPVSGFVEAHEASCNMVRRGAELLPELQALLDVLCAWSPPTDETLCWQHGDLHDKQVFLTGSGVSWIDLDGASLGDWRQDLANLAEHLRLRALQLPDAAGSEEVADYLLHRCGGSRSKADERLVAWCALTRARLAGVYSLRPRWRDIALRLGHEAREMLTRIP